MEETGRLEPKQEEEVIVEVTVRVVVEEEMEVIVSIVGAGNVGSHVMESMGSMGDD